MQGLNLIAVRRVKGVPDGYAIGNTDEMMIKMKMQMHLGVSSTKQCSFCWGLAVFNWPCSDNDVVLWKSCYQLRGVKHYGFLNIDKRIRMSIKINGFINPLTQQDNKWHHQMETFSALLAICAGNHRSPVNSSHKGQWRGAVMFSLICVWINGWLNNREAGDLRRYRAHYDVTVMYHVPKGLWNP